MDKYALIDGALMRLKHNVQFKKMSDHDKEKHDIEREYKLALNKILSEHNWSFARKTVNLNPINDEIGGYLYPEDCITILGVGKDYNNLEKKFYEANGRLYIGSDMTFMLNSADVPIASGVNCCTACGCTCAVKDKCQNPSCEKYSCKPRDKCLLWYISDTLMFTSVTYRKAGYFHGALMNLLALQLCTYFYSMSEKQTFSQLYTTDLAKAIVEDNRITRSVYKSSVKTRVGVPIAGSGAFGGGFGGGFSGGGWLW